MDIVFVSTEAVPFAKTGGLADVCGVLPKKLAERGHNLSLFIPAFRQVTQAGQPIELTGISFQVPMAGKTVSGRLLRTRIPESQVPVYLVDQPAYFDREYLYGDARGDYLDNCERFVFFCRAVVQAIGQLKLQPDVLHCHDWQTGLLPAYVATRLERQGWMEHTTTLMTIHNLAYQGQFWHWDMLLTGLGWEYFNWQQMEFYGQLNLLKTGIVFADALSTVSPRYAEEIKQPAHGCGLDGVLRSREQVLRGITNGVDYETWDPERDSHLAAPFDSERWVEGKALNRTALLKELGLPIDDDLPVIGLVGRLASQKGWDLVIDVMQGWLADRRPVKFVVLGSGDAHYQEKLSELARRFPDRLGLHIGFSDRLAHRIEAGSDLFLMPSRYEPCGLNQLYSLRYGAVPVVHPVGGLADTVTDTNDATLADGTATGFHMQSYHASSLSLALERALQMRQQAPQKWDQIVRTGMGQDWSWDHSAGEYERLYQDTIHRRVGLRG